jgi:hypothetical protein
MILNYCLFAFFFIRSKLHATPYKKILLVQNALRLCFHAAKGGVAAFFECVFFLDISSRLEVTHLFCESPPEKNWRMTNGEYVAEDKP